MNLGIIASSKAKFCAEFLAYDAAVVAAGGALSGTQKYALNTFIIGLKNAGLWNDLICFYPFLAATSNTVACEKTHTINMRTPGTYTLAYINGSQPSKHTSIYFETTASGGLNLQLLDTGIKPSVAITNENSVSWGAHVQDGQNIGAVFGARNSSGVGLTPTFSLNNRSSLGNPYASAYTYSSGTGYVIGSGGTGLGYIYAVRRSTTDLSVYENAVLKGIQTGSGNSGSRPTTNIYIGGYNNGTSYTPYGPKYIDNVWIATRGFSAGELTSFYTLESALNTSVGR
jgi:FlaG/FlaF family flagellin (archaellin)